MASFNLTILETSMSRFDELTMGVNVSNATVTIPSITTASDVHALSEVALSLRETRFAVQTILTPVVVIIGLLGNILNILVLFQPSMRSSTNVYILVLSFADSIYLVFNFALSILVCRKRGLPESAYYFNPYGRFVSNFSGNVAVWVTVGFTVERYIAVCHPMHGKRWCTVSRAKLASATIVILTLINTLPTIFELEVVETEKGPMCQYTSFAQSFSYEMGYSWWYVTVFTFIPLICLAIFNIVLIRALLVASQKRQELVMVSKSNSSASKNKKKKRSSSNGGTLQTNKYVNNGKCNSRSVVLVPEHDLTTTSSGSGVSSHLCRQDSGGNGVNTRGNNNVSCHISNKSQNRDTSPKWNNNVKRQSKRMSREQNKVTSLLVTIVMIFLLCQLPWTALFLYKTYLSNNNLTGNGTHMKIAGNICNLLGLINASVNFYLYSCFSKRFRKTFKSLILFWRRKSNFNPSML